ncbi:biotin synthase [Hydrogenophaga pseudoflava]|uniref:biotin synthase n=1 Tax=Hydrogenophaga pseudoflava TaxID=47421 RepID=UPI0027E42673|nr:biotin synthase [Hydrogenophaga pseudoflava]MDQ7744884.1 biotin synthase [Hydrogenophaga pseudoflava]
MTEETPVPGLDPVAARRWLLREHATSPWLNEEVARRMMDRLQWFREPPASWLHWEPLVGGLEAHRSLTERLPQARCLVSAEDPRVPGRLQGRAGRSLRSLLGWGSSRAPAVAGPDARVSMLWANMVLHQESRPQSLLRRWHGHIDVGGFLMFSCLGPDSLGELRAVYQEQGWPPPAHSFTDMHDWGDMLVQAGFAEPVMDMERIVLTYSSAAAMLDELRGFGRNLAAVRFRSLRGRGWRTRLESTLERHGPRDGQGRLTLGFEIIYGHAFKSAPRPRQGESQSVSVDEMRAMLRNRRA